MEIINLHLKNNKKLTTIDYIIFYNFVYFDGVKPYLNS